MKYGYLYSVHSKKISLSIDSQWRAMFSESEQTIMIASECAAQLRLMVDLQDIHDTRRTLIIAPYWLNILTRVMVTLTTCLTANLDNLFLKIGHHHFINQKQLLQV